MVVESPSKADPSLAEKPAPRRH